MAQERDTHEPLSSGGIAIIGMAGRFPGARDLGEFWRNLCQGREGISFFSREELLGAGVDPELLDDPAYVRARGVLPDAELFDAALFGLTPGEAELMDPQHRVFLECAWEALENAGYDPEAYRGSIGLFAGTGMNDYLLNNLLHHRDHLDAAGLLQVRLLNDKDFLVSHAAFRLGLTGPTVTVQTACSTSLVAVCMACQSLLGYQCDAVLAGGVRIVSPQTSGYLATEGVLSPDGHCRAFDAAARGTAEGNGAGVVVMKRLADAIADGDVVHAVVTGFATNNDGSFKIGFTAPSVDGQVEVVAMAHAVAGVSPETVTYVEAHGTATPLGDPIEVEALREVFGAATEEKGFCALGSVKTNVGHLDAAAGVAGLVKTVLAVEHGLLPPSLHFETPNPQIDFAATPFYVNTELSPWQPRGAPRRAGVSSFNMGGVNAHVIVEEAPPRPPSGASRPASLLLLSARTSAALERMTDALAAHLESHPEQPLADTAYTLQVGRRAFENRCFLVSREVGEAAAAMRSRERLATRRRWDHEPSVAFLFPGQGTQYPGMGAGLYENEPIFRDRVDRCSELLAPRLGADLRRLLYPPADRLSASAGDLRQTCFAQPALFVLEYALAELWMAWGIRPRAMIGHSVGELTAACLAGTFSLEQALELVALRGRLMQRQAPGAMLSVALPEPRARELLGDELALAAVNAPGLSTVAGPAAALEALERRLRREGVDCRRLHTSHAFHSPAMEPAAHEFRAAVAAASPRAPEIPFPSNLTGDWIRAREATDPDYWARQICRPVRFADGVARLLEEPDRAFLETGPGHTLATLVRQQASAEQLVAASLRAPDDEPAREDHELLLESLGRLWSIGCDVDWETFRGDERRQRVVLPTYPFERRRYWIEPAGAAASLPVGRRPIADWTYVPCWKQAPPADLLARRSPAGRWLLFVDGGELGRLLAARLAERGAAVTTVVPGARFERETATAYRLDPGSAGEYRRLLAELRREDRQLEGIVHLWTVTAEPLPYERVLELGFRSLVGLAQALAQPGETPALEVLVVSDRLHDVLGGEATEPEKATVLGPVLVMPQELAFLRCRSVDLGAEASVTTEQQVDRLMAEIRGGQPDGGLVAYRGPRRWLRSLEPAPIAEHPSPLVDRGVYLITGGLGGLGLVVARWLGSEVRARLVLLGRSGLPDRRRWPETLGRGGEAARRIRNVMELEESGSEVLVVEADVTDRAGTARAVAAAEKRFGRIRGVFHAAGVPGGELIELEQAATTAAVLAPKVEGTRALVELFRDAGLDFLVLFSSLNALYGGVGQVAYSAANAFLDAMAHGRPLGPEIPVVAIDWDVVRDVGMAAAASVSSRGGIRPDEVAEVLGRVLSRPLPQVAVSTRKPSEALALARRRGRELLRPKSAGAERGSANPSRRGVATPYVAPRNEPEEALAGIWQELFGIEPIGVDDDFFELGGHSLLATRLLARLRERLDLDLSPAELFARPTVAKLAAGRAPELGKSAESLPPIEPVARSGPLPLSFAQQRLWYLDRLESGSSAYNLPAAVELEGRLDVGALEASLGEVSRRHEVLRAGFHLEDGEPRQVIAPPGPFDLRVIDLRHLPAARRGPQARGLARNEVQRPFDLARDRLLRGRLFVLEDEEYLLLLILHHIVGDDRSLEILVRELTEIYRSLALGQAPRLPELSIQYGDVACWQRRWLRGPFLDAQLDYWRRHLGGELPAPALPADRPVPARRTHLGRYQPFRLSAELSRELRELCRRENATLFMAFLAAYSLLLGRYSRQEDVVVGVDLDGRNRPELEGLIGFFINMLVLRTDLSGNPTFRELLARTREVALRGLAHQDVPYDHLVAQLRTGSGRPRGELFRAVLNFINAAAGSGSRFAGGDAEGDLRLRPWELRNPRIRFDLMLMVTERGDTLSGAWVYSTELFDAGTIERFQAHLDTLLTGVVRRPDAPVAELEIVSQAEAEEERRQREARKQSRIRKLFDGGAAPGRSAVDSSPPHLESEESFR